MHRRGKSSTSHLLAPSAPTTPCHKKDKKSPFLQRIFITAILIVVQQLSHQLWSVVEEPPHHVDVILPSKPSSVRRKTNKVSSPTKRSGSLNAVIPSETETENSIGPARETKNKDGVHHYMVFSTDCSPKQNWQSYVFFYHAFKVGQPGNVTRIVAGCTDKQVDQLNRFHEEHVRPMSQGFNVHFTPNFGKEHNARSYETSTMYFNKPFGLRHWMKHALGYPERTDADDSIVIMMDPDMILLRPITYDFGGTKVEWRPRRDGTRNRDQVDHGFPFAQQYGYGQHWLLKLQSNLTYIVGEDSPAANVSVIEAADSYPVGPPYLATGRDMFQIVIKWTEIVPKVHDVFPHLLTEMFAYSLAAAHLRLPHQLATSFMVSDVRVTYGEGWNVVDRAGPENVCDPLPTERLPLVLHYCQSYMLGKWFIDKNWMRKDFLSCESPLLMEPPNDIAQSLDYFIFPSWRPRGVQEKLSPKEVKRHAFMLCNLIPALNEAAVHYKGDHCGGQVNLEKNHVFHKTVATIVG